MHKKQFFGAGCGLFLMLLLLTVFLSPPGESVRAFNQSNLIRVAEVREVDGELFYRRVAPVYEIHP
ncbi:MAG: hypothetical protein SCK29_07840 [Bacillota bacterium]|nr:hypothetical protein [Bacillota bacterium]MDW7684007.1 hypothetical protein [Bacillota bacterium]